MASFLDRIRNNVGGNQDLTNATKPSPPNTGVRTSFTNTILNQPQETAVRGIQLGTPGGPTDSPLQDLKLDLKPIDSQIKLPNVGTPSGDAGVALPVVGGQKDKTAGDLKVDIGGPIILPDLTKKEDVGLQLTDPGIVKDEPLPDLQIDLKDEFVGGKTDIGDLAGADELAKAKDFLTKLLEGQDVFKAEHNKAIQDLQNMNASQMNVLNQQMAQQGISGDNALIFKMMQNRGFSSDQAGMLAQFSSDIAQNKMGAAQQLANLGLSEMGIDMQLKQQELDQLNFEKNFGLQSDQLKFNKLLAQKELEMKQAAQNAAIWAADLATYDASTKEGMAALKQSWSNLFGDKAFPTNIHEMALDAAFNKSVADGMTYLNSLPNTIGPDGKSFKDTWLAGGWKNDSKFLNDADKAFENAHGGEGRDVYGDDYVDNWIQGSFIPVLDKTPDSETIATLTQIITNQPGWQDLTEEQKQNAINDIETFVKLGGKNISVGADGTFTIFDSEGNAIYNSGGKEVDTGIGGDFDFDNLKDVELKIDPVTDQQVKIAIGPVKDSDIDYDTHLINFDTPQTTLAGHKGMDVVRDRIKTAIDSGGVDSLSPEDLKMAIDLGIHVPEGGLKFHYDAKQDKWINTHTGTTVSNAQLKNTLNSNKKDMDIDPTKYLEEDDIYFEDGKYKIITEGTSQPYNPFDEITRIDDSSRDFYLNIDNMNIPDNEKARLKTHIEGLLGDEWKAGGLDANDLKSNYQTFSQAMGHNGYAKFLKGIGAESFDDVTKGGLTQSEGGAGGSTSGSSAWIEFSGLEGKTAGDMVMYFGRPTMIYDNPSTVDVKGDDNERVYYLQDAITGQKFAIQTSQHADNKLKEDWERKPEIVTVVSDDGSVKVMSKATGGDWKTYKDGSTISGTGYIFEEGWL